MVFVGDADPAVIEAKIKKTFADWKGVGATGAPLPRGKVDFARPASFDTFIDPAVATTVELHRRPPVEGPRGHDCGSASKDRRGAGNGDLQPPSPEADQPAGVDLAGWRDGDRRAGDAALVTAVTLIAKDGDWKDALTAVEQEIRRGVEHGFTAAELKTEIAQTTGALHAAADQQDTRTNKELAMPSSASSDATSS